MYCEMKLADWNQEESTQAGGYALHRGETVKLEMEQVTNELINNPALQLPVVYTKEELEKLSTMQLHELLGRVKTLNAAKRRRKEIFDELEAEEAL